MWFPSIFQKPGFCKKPGFSAHAKPRRGIRLSLEQLEDRTLLSSYSAATVADLIADINAANAAGGSNTITLAHRTTFDLTQANNTTDGSPTGLPVIAAGDNLTIAGNAGTIERSYASGTPTFRLFDVASGASLILEHLTLQNGYATSTLTTANGGAIYTSGGLALNGVTVTGNAAYDGLGVYVAAGGASFTNDTVENQCCTGYGDAAAISFAAFTSGTFCNDTIAHNSVGGIFIGNNGVYGGASVFIDHFTVQHTVDNAFNIEGNYIVAPPALC